MTSEDHLPLTIFDYDINMFDNDSSLFTRNKNTTIQVATEPTDEFEAAGLIMSFGETTSVNSKTPGVLFKGHQLNPKNKYRFTAFGIDPTQKAYLYAGNVSRNIEYISDHTPVVFDIDDGASIVFIPTTSVTDLGVLITQAKAQEKFLISRVRLQKIENVMTDNLLVNSNYLTLDTEQTVREDKEFICDIDMIGQININSDNPDFSTRGRDSPYNTNINCSPNNGLLNLGNETRGVIINGPVNFTSNIGATGITGAVVVSGGLNVLRNTILGEAAENTGSHEIQRGEGTLVFPTTGSNLVLNGDASVDGLLSTRYDINTIVGSVFQRGYLLVPPGCIFPFAGNCDGTPWPNAPDGYLLCNGATHATSLYPDLFSVIGHAFAYGRTAGSSSTYFYVPDMRNKFPLGAMNYSDEHLEVGHSGGSFSHTLSIEELPSHNHGINDPGHTHGNNTEGDSNVGLVTYTGINTMNSDVNDGAEPDLYAGRRLLSINRATTGITTGYTGGSQAIDITPPFVVLHYIIKY